MHSLDEASDGVKSVLKSVRSFEELALEFRQLYMTLNTMSVVYGAKSMFSDDE